MEAPKYQILTLAALVFVVAILAALVLSGSGQKDPPQFKGLSFVSQAIAHGQSVAVLPPELAELSVDGKIYITNTPEANIVLWRTQLGKAGHFHGVVYWEGTLPEVDKLELNAPSAKGVVKWEIAHWQKAQVEHWAYVSTDFMD